MSEMLPVASAAAPLAGWGLHAMRMRRQLNHARRDPLTGLATRTVFERQAEHLLRKQTCSVLVIDLDGFKALNDTYGHAAGDAAIRAIGERLHTAITRVQGGVVGRLGGDEFAAAMDQPHYGDLPYELATLHGALCKPVAFEGRFLPLGASIGCCWTAELPGPDVSLALRRADEAMYVVKRGGGGWLTADGAARTHATVNGRRAGRTGTHDAEAGAGR